MSATYKNFLITIIIVGVVTSGLIGFLNNVSVNYGNAMSGNLSGTFDRVNQSLTDMHEFGDSFQAGAEGAKSSALDSLTTMWAVIKLPFTTLGTIRTIISEFSAVLGLPNWFTYSLITIIVIVLTTIAIAILTRRVET